MNRYVEYLSHHGILGMKWGKRNGPPYPLSSSAHSSSEKKAGWQKSLNSSNSSKNEATKKKSNISKSNSKQLTNNLISKFGNKPVGELTVEDKSAIAYISSMFAVAIATFVISDTITNKKDQKRLEQAKNRNKVKRVEDLDRLKTKAKASDSVKVVNPGFKEKDKDTNSTMNCTNCTSAMAMREKGYDVKAVPNSNGHTMKNIEKVWNSKSISVKKDKLESQLISQGNGAYGNLTVDWNLGGSHSIFYKVENNGLTIYDGQSGKIYKDHSYDDLLTKVRGKVLYNRLDNVEPTDMMLSMVINRKD